MKVTKAQKSALLALALVIALLSVLSIACDIEDDIPRVGDGLRIAEALEKAACEAQGGRWSDRHNACYHK